MIAIPAPRVIGVVALMFLATVASIYLRPHGDGALPGTRPDLDGAVPNAFAGWNLDRSERPIPLSPDLQATIDRTYDEVVERTYMDRAGHRVMLSVFYASRFEWSNGVHRPEICYPAQGFVFEGRPEAVRLLAAGRSLRATRLVMVRGRRREPITYWLIMGARQVRFGLEMNWLQIRKGLTGALPEGTLVRISTIGADPAAEFAVQEGFADDLLRAIDPADRALFTGRADDDASHD